MERKGWLSKKVEGAPTLDDLRRQIEEAERRMTPEARLWAREWSAMTVRGVLRTLRELEGTTVLDFIARCEALRKMMRELDARDFDPLRARMEAGTYSPADLERDLTSLPRFEWDTFTQKLLDIDETPATEKERDLDMVHYLPSPFEAIVDIVGELKEDDVFYDLGCGLGKVTLFVGWLSKARAKGVELEPAFTRVLEGRAKKLQLSRVEVVTADAREVDYSDGTVFYFYDPFRGEILDAVLTKLEAEAKKRPIRICSRGKSTPPITALTWLEPYRETASELVFFRPRVASRVD